MTLRLWPRSLAARTAVVLLAGLMMVQIAGLTIHAFDRIDLQRLEAARDIAIRVMSLYRTVVMTNPNAAPDGAGRGASRPRGGCGNQPDPAGEQRCRSCRSTPGACCG